MRSNSLDERVYKFFYEKIIEKLCAGRKINLRGPGVVQHGVWTRLHFFMIISESIDIVMKCV